MLANTARRAGVQVRGAAPPWALAAGCADFAVSVAWLAACLRSRGAACGVRRSAFQCLPHGMRCIVCTYVPGPWCCCHWRAAVVPWRLCGDLRPVRGAHRSCFVSLCCAPATCAHRPRGLSSASGYVPLHLGMLHVAWPMPRCGCACGRVTGGWRAPAHSPPAVAVFQQGFFTGVFSDHPGQTPLDQEIAGCVLVLRCGRGGCGAPRLPGMCVLQLALRSD